MTELKPCPFCGNAAYPGYVRYSAPLEGATWADGSEILEAHYINCGTCLASNRNSIAGGHRTEAEAESSWNRRVSFESVNADLLEALRPFADLAYFYPNDANETLVCGTMKPTVGNLRRALNAISLAEKSNG